MIRFLEKVATSFVTLFVLIAATLGFGIADEFGDEPSATGGQIAEEVKEGHQHGEGEGKVELTELELLLIDNQSAVGEWCLVQVSSEGSIEFNGQTIDIESTELRFDETVEAYIEAGGDVEDLPVLDVNSSCDPALLEGADGFQSQLVSEDS